ILLIVLIAVNIIFDMIAVAVTSCNLEPFLAMAARKISGAKMAVKILKNAEKVSNICADVVGDICGIISGSLSAAIVAVLLASGLSWDKVFVSILFSSVTAAFTVGGKAFGKKFAMVNAQKIVFTVAKIFSVFQKNP
ncbi:MAG: hypothetical protein IJF71_07175, partial [Clostridia bacterium]|nr:hypothetical protein [Clostridia bacterium]